MHFFRQPASPFWFVSFTDSVSGKRVKRSTKETAMRAARKAATEIIQKFAEDARPASEKVQGVTIEAALRRYLSWLETERKASSRHAGIHVRKTLGEGFEGRFSLDGRRLLVSLTPADMDEMVRARIAEGNSPQTAAHEVKTLRAAANYVADLGGEFPPAMVSRSGRANPWRLPQVKAKTRYLTREEWQSVYDHLDPFRSTSAVYKNGAQHDLHPSPATVQSRLDIRDLFVILTVTGGRWSEVARLTWDRVDTVEFRHVRFWGSKSNRERVAPLPASASDILRRRYEARETVMVFPGGGGKRFRTDASGRPIIAAMDACGLNREDIVACHGRATVHSLRHTYASWLLQNGADLAEVQEGLGHTTLDMTRRYAHLSQSRTAQRITAVFDALADVKPLGHDA
ncbi:hypothetical protein C0V97_12560 [Asaia sp. W19]|nr:hypothetical protein C0V97_12560 [Asaia sp. W19]